MYLEKGDEFERSKSFKTSTSSKKTLVEKEGGNRDSVSIAGKLDHLHGYQTHAAAISEIRTKSYCGAHGRSAQVLRSRRWYELQSSFAE